MHKAAGCLVLAAVSYTHLDVYKRQVQMPEEWKGGIDLSTFGRNAAAQDDVYKRQV